MVNFFLGGGGYFCFLICCLKEGDDLAFVANKKIKVKMKNFRTLKT